MPNNELFIYDAIGADFYSSGVMAKDVVEELSRLDRKQPLVVRINSPGGVVHEAVTIRSHLVDWPGGVIVKIDGLAASMASYIATVSPEVIMAEGAMYMIHDPWTGVAGNADMLRKEADVLDEHAESMVGAYVAKSGKSREEIRAVMKEEMWLKADAAIEYGFADKKADSMAMGCVIPKQFGFKNCPLPMADPVPRTRPNLVSAQLTQLHDRVQMQVAGIIR
jgi:ATP-dependent Clp protease, protease subunit